MRATALRVIPQWILANATYNGCLSAASTGFRAGTEPNYFPIKDTLSSRPRATGWTGVLNSGPQQTIATLQGHLVFLGFGYYRQHVLVLYASIVRSLGKNLKYQIQFEELRSYILKVLYHKLQWVPDGPNTCDPLCHPITVLSSIDSVIVEYSTNRFVGSTFRHSIVAIENRYFFRRTQDWDAKWKSLEYQKYYAISRKELPSKFMLFLSSVIEILEAPTGKVATCI